MARSRTTGGMKDVEAFRHTGETRLNIPTEEMRDFVTDDEVEPETMLYPRDPSLDPQLVWKGKDEQDRHPLAVPVVPIYIQEKIRPQALIDDLRTRHAATPDGQLDLFADFDGLEDDFAKQVEFYQHPQHWSNRLILGDSLLVMTSLAEKEGLKGKVQTIYLDPPYGIKFGSNWQVSTRKRDVKDGSAADATRQPEQVKAFRDTWQLGIHSYLAYLRDRFAVARDLLTESGSIFVQIGDENVHLVRSVLDEVFGADNFCGQIPFKKTTAMNSGKLDHVNDYLLWYARDSLMRKYRQLYRNIESDLTSFTWAEDSNGTVMKMTDAVRRGIPISDLQPFRSDNLTSRSGGESTLFPVELESRSYRPSNGRFWQTNSLGMEKLRAAGRLFAVGSTLAYKRYYNDFPVRAVNNWWDDTVQSTFAAENMYVVQTYTKVIERCLLMTTDPGDLVLDPTCGSGTTAFVAEQWGRRWITIDTSRVALALARTRLMAAKFPYYLLADSREGQRKEAELTGVASDGNTTGGDISKGFVYRRLPRITLGSISRNPDIHAGMTRAEIDRAIARHADTETLYDQPYEDNGTVRVSGPFTVESLSPHRVLSTGDDNLDGRLSEREIARQDEFAETILEYLRKTPIQNSVRDERMKLDNVQVHAGQWLNATGEYVNADGEIRRVAISLGPEHGTVGPQQVKDAAKEAVKGIGYDVLLVCGFAFDPFVSEEARRYGNLAVLPVRMNPDLMMGEELLKKTGAGNLFMVFGEPDIDLLRREDGQLAVSIKGVDVYDPTTGEVRSNDPDQIACWFIDTAYNEESFFVRHAYFTGADTPYEKLKRALRAEIDEDAWASLYRTESRPFDRPATGKIAVKVINHYGDEVMKVFPV